MKSLSFALLGCLICISVCGQQLPSNLTFPDWTDETQYTKTYHVNQNHHNASDENSGTREAPFLTISKAAEVLQPGEKVIIHSGVYRESVQPARGGKDAKNMIGYEAARGEEVTISGSIPVKGVWEQSLHPENQRAYSRNLWQLDLKQVLDMDSPNPFNQPNATSQQMTIMSWATALDGTPPFTLVRGMVFQNGERLVQLAHYGDLTRIKGSYFVDKKEHILHIHPLHYADPNEEIIEITRFEHLFKPREIATSYLHIKALTFSHAGNGFMRTGVGAVFVNGGNHWIIEENTIHSVNTVGLEIGIDFTEDRKQTPAEKEKIYANKGGHLVLNNTIFNCGTGGIQGHRNHQVKVTGNHLYEIGWQDTENYWECAAIKLLLCQETLVSHNTIHDITAANAIWLDWDNINCRVTSNLIYDIHPAMGGAVYIEASRKTPNWIDHNILYNINNVAISVFDSDNTVTFNNLIAHSRIPYISKVNTQGRAIGGVPLSSENNQLNGNIFYHNHELPSRESQSNTGRNNLFTGMDTGGFIRQNWGTGNEEWDLELSLKDGSLNLKTAKALPKFELQEQLPDYFGSYSSEQFRIAGPFQSFSGLEATFSVNR
jgi:hypothetical protein